MPVRNKLPRSLTLKSRVEISVLLKQGRRVYGSNCTAVWQPSEGFKYGILLSRRSGKAYQRNRIKRLYREALRAGRSMLVAPIWLAILPRSADRMASLEEIKTDVTRLFEQINRQI